jgi:hypothetical protein
MDQHPESVTYIVPMVITMLKAGWNENLDLITSALSPVPELAAQAQRILDMPATTIEANLAGQTADIRQRAQRLIDATIEGQLDSGASD